MLNKFHVYIAINSENKLYIGQTNNLSKRIIRHQESDGAKYTKDNKSDFKLIYSEVFKTRKEAMKRELQIKKWSRAKKEALISGNYKQLKKLSKSTGKKR